MDSVDAQFLRWRTSGDLDALGAVYDAAAPGLLRMALHHVRHPAMAEDLVQTTFVAAIHQAARWDASRPLLGWLTGILANHAKWQQRREGRAVDAARLHTAEPADPLALAAAAEFTAQCDATIETLPELYRPVLRLSLKHELQAAEIAHVLGRPAGTVRSQITRGLELLRAALPAGVALGAFAVLLPARGLLAVRAEVLGAAKSAATAAVATTAAAAVVTGTSLWIGGVAMKKVVVGLAVVLLVGWWMLPPSGASASPPQHDVNAAGVVAASAPEASRGDATLPMPVAERGVERAAGTEPVRWELTGRVVDADGAPAVGAHVHVRVDFGGEEESLPPVTADNEGLYCVDLEPLRETPPIDRTRGRVLATVMVSGHATAAADVELPHRDPERALHAMADFGLAVGCGVIGRVIDRDERPVGEARVDLQFEGGTVVATGYSGADGVFRIVAPVEAAGSLKITHLQHGVADVPCAWKERADTSVGDIVLRGDELMARVVFDNGEPAAGIGLLVATDADQVVGMLTRVTTDAQGWVRLVPAAPTVHRLFARVSDERLHCDLVPGATPPTFVLEGLRLLRFRYADADERPLHDLDITYSVWKPSNEVLARPPAIGGPLPEVQPSRGAGHVPTLLLPVGSFVHVAAHCGEHGAEVVVQAPPAPNVVDTRLVLRPRTRDAGLRLVLSASDGGDVGAFRVQLEPLRLGDPRDYEFAMQRRDGAFEGWWHAGRYRVNVVPPGRLDEQWFVRQSVDVELVVGRTTEVPVAAPIGGRLRVRFHLPPERSGPVRGWTLACSAAAVRGPADVRTLVQTTHDGWSTVRDDAPAGVPLLWQPILPPGRHEVQITADGFAPTAIGVDIRPRAVTDVDVHLQPR